MLSASPADKEEDEMQLRKKITIKSDRLCEKELYGFPLFLEIKENALNEKIAIKLLGMKQEMNTCTDEQITSRDMV